MSDHFWLSEEQLARIKPYFPLSHWVPRVDVRKVVSGIIHVIRNGLRWRDAPTDYGPPDSLMIDATHLKAHRNACSLLKGGMFPALSGAPRAG